MEERQSFDAMRCSTQVIVRSRKHRHSRVGDTTGSRWLAMASAIMISGLDGETSSGPIATQIAGTDQELHRRPTRAALTDMERGEEGGAAGAVQEAIRWITRYRTWKGVCVPEYNLWGLSRGMRTPFFAALHHFFFFFFYSSLLLCYSTTLVLLLYYSSHTLPYYTTAQ